MVVGVAVAGAALTVARGPVASVWHAAVHACAGQLQALTGTLGERLGGGFGALPALLGLVGAMLLPLLVAAACAARGLRVLVSCILAGLAVAGLWSDAPSGSVLLVGLLLALWVPGFLASAAGAFALVSAVSLLGVGVLDGLIQESGLRGLAGLSPVAWRVLLLGLEVAVIAAGLRLLWGGPTAPVDPEPRNGSA